MPTIRPATLADLDRLTALLELLFAIEKDFVFDPVRQRRGLAMLIANEWATVLVGVAAGRVVGMCTGQLTISTAEGGPSLLIEDVVVEPAHRGTGLGTSLLNAVAAWATEHGAERLQLLADRDNDAGLHFYQKRGWQRTAMICLRKRVTT
ncbi:MAG: GNAT family N-acetyltransferase [Desulfobulbaceae bacterium]|nr:GNAT family N-acetyltransferase [Desulfobulbaceae bacterium]